MPNRPLWVEVSIQRLLANYQQLREAASPRAGLLPVVKANAYGHGVLSCAPLLAGAGAEWLGVTGAEEGVAVRAVCPHARILLMSGLWPGEADAVLEHRLIPVVWESYQLDLLEEASARRGLARASVPVHLEIDTGMSRQGVRFIRSDAGSPSELITLLDHFPRRSCLQLEGVMTHFSTPEAIYRESPGENPQLANLSAAVDLILEPGTRTSLAARGQFLDDGLWTRPGRAYPAGVAGADVPNLASRSGPLRISRSLQLRRKAGPGRRSPYPGRRWPGVSTGAELEDTRDLPARHSQG